MDSLIKAFEKFIVRDLIYIVGGTCVMLSFLYLLGKMNVLEKYSMTVVSEVRNESRS